MPASSVVQANVSVKHFLCFYYLYYFREDSLQLFNLSGGHRGDLEGEEVVGVVASEDELVAAGHVHLKQSDF